MLSRILRTRCLATEGIRQTVRVFANEFIAPHVASMDSKGEMRPELVTKLFEHGLMSIDVPTEYGGAGMTFTDTLVAIEEIARVDPSVAVLVDIHNTLLNRALLRFGTENQKKQYLSSLCTDTVGSFCISEASSGSDAFALQTRATKRSESEFSISGEKMWISNSRDGAKGLLLVFATEDPSKRHKGVSAFLVDRSAHGVNIQKKEDKLGIRASSTCGILFNDAKSTELLGKSGDGYKVAISLLNEGRIGIAAQMLGLSKGALSGAIKFVKERKQFGAFISEFQGVRFQLAQMRTEIEAVHDMVYSAARSKEYVDSNGIDPSSIASKCSMTKLFASQVAERVASKSLELMGGYGFTKDFTAEKYFRDSKIGSIYEGTSNMQLETIGRRVLKEDDCFE